MVDVLDVATALIERSRPLTTYQLQKLTYYVQAWHAAVYGDGAFNSEIQAWSNGPVSPDLHSCYRKMKSVGGLTFGDSSKLNSEISLIVDLVLAQYGNLDGDQLVAITHEEEPWIAARGSCAPSDWSQNAISVSAMSAFYSKKTLDGHSPAEIAVIGVNPAVRDEESAAAVMGDLLREWTTRVFEPSTFSHPVSARLISGFDSQSYTDDEEPFSASASR